MSDALLQYQWFGCGAVPQSAPLRTVLSQRRPTKPSEVPISHHNRPHRKEPQNDGVQLTSCNPEPFELEHSKWEPWGLRFAGVSSWCAAMEPGAGLKLAEVCELVGLGEPEAME